MPSKLLGAPGTPRPTPSRPVGTRYDEGLRAERAEVPLNGGDAGILWAEYSPYPAEAGIAGRRYKQLAPLYTDPWALLMAVCEAAFEGHHAAGACNDEYLRSRAARIRETVYSEQKAERTFSQTFDKPLGKPNWNIFADAAAVPTREGKKWGPALSQVKNP